MATKEAVFNVKVNTGNSVKEVQDLDKSLDNLNKATDETTKSTRDVNATFEQVYGELQPLTTRLGEAEDRLYELSLAGETASDEFKELLETVTNYRKTQIAVDATVDASAQTMSQKLVSSVEFGASAFQGYESAVALAGVESEALVQTMVKLQAIQGLVGSLKGLQEGLGNVTATFKSFKGFGKIIKQNTILQKANTAATAIASGVMKLFGASVAQTSLGFKALRGAIIATGIGALVVGVGALVSALGNWISSENELKKAAEARAKALEKGLRGIDEERELAKATADLRGKSQSEALKEEIKFLEEKEKLLRKAAQDEYQHYSDLYDDDWGPINDETKEAYQKHLDLVKQTGDTAHEIRLKQVELQKAINAEYIENEQRRNQALQEEANHQIAILEARGEDSFELQKKELERQIELLKADGIFGFDDEDLEEFEDVKKIRRDLELLEVRHNKKMAEERKTAYDKYKANLEKRNTETINTLKKAYDDEIKLQDLYNQLRIQNISDARQKELETAQNTFEKFQRQYLDERIQDEINAQNELFKLGKINAETYEQRISDLRLNALNELTEKERDVLTEARVGYFHKINEINKKFDEEDLKREKEKEEERKELIESYNAIFRDQFEQQIQDERMANEERLKELEKVNKQGLISDGEFYLAKLKLASDLADKEKEIEREKNEYIKEQQIKAREEQLKGITKVIEGAQKGLDSLSQINDLVNEIDQARLNSIQNRRDENLENLDANLQAQLNNENLTAEQKAQIEENFAQQKFAIQQKAFEEEEKIKRAQFNRDKALKLAQVSIDTASAIVKAIAQFGPPPSPLGIAGIASAGVIGLTQALAILNQQYQGGSAPSPPQVGGGGASAGALTGAGASTFTANTQAEQTDLSTIGQDVPVSQVVVLESDITGTQSKVAVQEAKSSF